MSDQLKNKIIKIIKNYGQTITFKETPESTTSIASKAFIQPIKYEDFLNLNGYYLGNNYTYSEDDFYKYIGLPEVRLDLFEKGIITNDGTNYSIKDAEKICLSDEIFYIQAVLQRI